VTVPAGTWGAWATAFRLAETQRALEAAEVLDRNGCSALWMTGALSNPFDRVRELLAATTTVTVATGILSIWTMTPEEVIAEVQAIPADSRDRFLLGLGVSHQQLVDRGELGRYTKPLTRMREYLDKLDTSAARARATSPERVLAALGPKMLELSASRARGAHPYLTTVEHTASARSIIGVDAFLAPTQMALIEDDPVRARSAARGYLAMYLKQPNYLNSWRALGFADDDFSDGGSDRLVDSLVAWGSPDQVASRLREHVTAGADHVCIQLLDPNASWADQSIPLDDWAVLLKALI
jgi:probable F420-dependent oxidoreductase